MRQINGRVRLFTFRCVVEVVVAVCGGGGGGVNMIRDFRCVFMCVRVRACVRLRVCVCVCVCV